MAGMAAVRPREMHAELVVATATDSLGLVDSTVVGIAGVVLEMLFALEAGAQVRQEVAREAGQTAGVEMSTQAGSAPVVDEAEPGPVVGVGGQGGLRELGAQDWTTTGLLRWMVVVDVVGLRPMCAPGAEIVVGAVVGVQKGLEAVRAANSVFRSRV